MAKKYFGCGDKSSLLLRQPFHKSPREAWLNGQCYGNWKIAPPSQLGAAPAERRNATLAPAVAFFQAPAAAEISHVIRDFARGGFDYPYSGWKASQLTSGSDGGTGYVQIDANEPGGAGIVLNGANIAPQGQKFLVLRARLVAGNIAGRVVVNLVGADKSVTFDLRKLSTEKFVTLAEPLPADGKYDRIQQVQMQGANWGAGAQPLKIQMGALGTANADETSAARNSNQN